MIECHQLDAEATAHLWPDLVPTVERALEHDPYLSISIPEIAQQLDTGFARMLLAVDGTKILGATVCQMYKRGERRILHILITAGVDLQEWIEPMLDEIESLASEQEIDAITLSGRPGWARTLRRFGYRTDHVEMVKVVNDGRRQQEQKPTANLERLASIR